MHILEKNWNDAGKILWKRTEETRGEQTVCLRSGGCRRWGLYIFCF